MKECMEHGKELSFSFENMEYAEDSEAMDIYKETENQ